MSSYVKALEGVMRLFPKKITVTFVHVSGAVIGVSKIYEEQLPQVFKKPMILEGLGRSWRVLKAEPLESKDFVYTRKLSLVVVEPELAAQYVPEFFTATIAGTMPEIAESSDYSDFGIDISGDEWRQVELLPTSCLALVTEEIAAIEAILRPGKGISVLRGFERRHVREKIGAHALNLPMEALCKLVDASKPGYLRFNHAGYVRNGFTLQSAGFTYYGTADGGVISNLCLHNFDCADLELFSVLFSFDLVMVQWCKGKILTSEVKETNEISEEPGGGESANII